MKYLLNLPLCLAALFQAWFTSLVLMQAPWSGWGDGPSRGAMAFVMLEPAVFCWLLLLLAMVGAASTDAFDWLPVRRRWLRRLLVVGAALLTVVSAVPCVATAIGGSAPVADRDTAEFGRLFVTGAMVVAVAVPFALAGWLAWLIDVPSPWRDALWARGIGLGALALLLLIGSPLGTQMLAEEIRTDLATSRRYQQEIDERETARTADFAKLTDASPLHSWGSYATDDLDLKERREMALRRLAARPTVEADLARDLVSSYARDSDVAFLLVERVRFAPSTALEAPLRTAMSRIAGEMRKAGFGEAWPGDSATLDSYIRSGFAERLAASLVIARRMADSAGVDLRDALGELQSAAIGAYPKTKSAETYQREVAAADKYIEAALAARLKPN